MKYKEWELSKVCREDSNLVCIEIIPIKSFCQRVHEENKLKNRKIKYEVMDNAIYYTNVIH